MKKVVMVGTCASFGRIFVEIEYRDGGKLSITGVEGPMRNGNARGSCGQLTLDSEKIEPNAAEGWTREKIARLAEVWKRWHLNNMRSGCEHQRAEKWSDRPIDPSKPTNAYGTHFEGQSGASWNMLAWVRPSEHPQGLLGKPCEVCGYKYGTAWLREEVPADVLAFLKELPETAVTYPWA